MLFSILEYPIPKHTYSFAIITECSAKNTYKVKFKEAYALIHTASILNTGDWIRFYGSYDGKIIKCEFVEILNGVDINILIKLINKTNLIDEKINK
jgi:hypothetical protein